MALALGVSHLLIVVRLFHLLPLTLLCAYGIWHTRLRHRGPSQDRAAGMSVLGSAWLWLTDVGSLAERRGWAIFGDVGRAMRRRAATTHERARHPRRVLLLVVSLPILSVFAWSLWTRMELAARFATLSPPASYVTLTWTKALIANDLYPDGIYPAGSMLFLALLRRGSIEIDAYDAVRFGGPLLGALLVVGIYYAIVRLTHSIGAATLAATTFGIFGTAYAWHEPWTRQTGVTPQELGLVVILFALPTAVLAVTERAAGRDHLRTVAAAGLATGLIHPVPAVLWIVIVLVASVATALVARVTAVAALRTTGAAVTGGLVSQVPIVVALVAGIPIFRGLDNPYVSLTATGSVDEALVGALGTSGIGHTVLSITAAAGVAAALVVGIVLSRRGRPRIGGQLAGLAGAGGVAVLLYDGRWLPLGVNHLGPLANLGGVMTALGLGAAAAVALRPVEHWRRLARRPLALRVATSIALGGIAAVALMTPLPKAERFREPSEYEATAAVTREVMSANESFGYTIIGTPQQAQAVSGSGSVIELWVFTRDVTLRDARDPGFVVPDVASLLFARDLGETLPIPTQNIYLFVEKVPFPVTEQAPVGPAEEYYYNRDKRGRMMALAYGWAEFYRHYHTDMDIYYEDDELIVYRIQRRPNTLVAASSPQFKDYNWQPGVLFNRGPTDPGEVVIPWEDA